MAMALSSKRSWYCRPWEFDDMALSCGGAPKLVYCGRLSWSVPGAAVGGFIGTQKRQLQRMT